MDLSLAAEPAVWLAAISTSAQARGRQRQQRLLLDFIGGLEATGRLDKPAFQIEPPFRPVIGH